MSSDTTLTEEDLDAMLGELDVPGPTAAPLPDDELTAALEAEASTSSETAPVDVAPAQAEKTAPAPADDPVAALESDLEALEASSGAPVEPTPVAVEPEPTPAPAPEPEKPVTAPAPEKDYSTKVQAFVNADELKRDVRINPTDLDNAMIEHAALFVHYASQAVKARSQYDRVKNAFEILEAKLDAEHRERFAEEGKKVTEAQIKAAMTADPRWSKGQALVIESHGVWKLADIAQSAFDQRKDLLLEVARDRRKEKEGQLRVLEGEAQRERVQELLRSRAA